MSAYDPGWYLGVQRAKRYLRRVEPWNVPETYLGFLPGTPTYPTIANEWLDTRPPDAGAIVRGRRPRTRLQEAACACRDAGAPLFVNTGGGSFQFLDTPASMLRTPTAIESQRFFLMLGQLCNLLTDANGFPFLSEENQRRTQACLTALGFTEAAFEVLIAQCNWDSVCIADAMRARATSIASSIGAQPTGGIATDTAIVPGPKEPAPSSPPAEKGVSPWVVGGSVLAAAAVVGAIVIATKGK